MYQRPLVFSVARAILSIIFFLLFTNYLPNDRSFPIVFANDFIYLAVSLFFGLSSGFLSSICMMNAPKYNPHLLTFLKLIVVHHLRALFNVQVGARRTRRSSCGNAGLTVPHVRTCKRLAFLTRSRPFHALFRVARHPRRIHKRIYDHIP